MSTKTRQYYFAVDAELVEVDGTQHALLDQLRYDSAAVVGKVLGYWIFRTENHPTIGRWDSHGFTPLRDLYSPRVGGHREPLVRYALHSITSDLSEYRKQEAKARKRAERHTRQPATRAAQRAHREESK